MSNFTDFIAKTTSEKIILFELDYGEEQARWYNYESGIWAWKYYTYRETDHDLGNGNLGFGPLGGSNTNTGSGETAFHTLIGSVGLVRKLAASMTAFAFLTLSSISSPTEYTTTGISGTCSLNSASNLLENVPSPDSIMTTENSACWATKDLEEIRLSERSCRQ